jgi:hypothetical protein
MHTFIEECFDEESDVQDKLDISEPGGLCVHSYIGKAELENIYILYIYI